MTRGAGINNKCATKAQTFYIYSASLMANALPSHYPTFVSDKKNFK